MVEQRVAGRGFFGVRCAGLPTDPVRDPGSGATRGHAGLAYEAVIGGVSYKAFVYGEWRDERTVYDAAIEGVALGDAIAIGDSTTPSSQKKSGQPVSSYSPTTTGANTLLYIIAHYNDQTADPIDDSTALSQMGVVSNFWINCSYGMVYLHGLVNSNQPMDIVHVMLPHPSSYVTNYNNNFAGLLSDARSAASALGFNYANYNLDLTVTPSSGFGYAGIAYIGAQGAQVIAGYTSLRTSGHELGHNLGLYHADYWLSDATMPFGKDSNPGGYAPDSVNGEWIEYGHYFSVMSGQYSGDSNDATKPHYAPAEKVALGWLSGTRVQYVTTSGTYRIFRHDWATTVGVPRAIRIETPATDYTGYGRRYWLGYRYSPWATAQPWLQNGIQVDVCQTGYGSDGAIMLDMTPYSKDGPSGSSYTSDNNDKVDGMLVVGNTYADKAAGIYVTPIATGNNGTGEEYIDMVINLGSFAGNHPPTITAFSASTNFVTTGQSVNLSVSATDPDGDTMAYAWDFDEVQVWTASGLNSPTATKSWSSPGQYRVMVKVSDRKGGVTTAAQIITVGTPANTGQIWGRVVWAGQGVYGARVSTTSGGQAWTESDGSYVLTDLTPGNSYVVNCQSDGLTFTPQFSNPVSLANTNAYGIDFYANQLLPGGGGTTFTISGQVTDGGLGVAGAEVRGGGMLATTDSGGNFVFSNLVNGSYTLTPRKDNWTFSPATLNVNISSANSTGNNFSRVAPYSISGSFSGIPTGHGTAAPIVYLSNGRSVAATGGSSGKGTWSYTLSSVPAGTYYLGAELSGYNLIPSGFSNPLIVGGSLNNQNFSGSVASVAGAISGRIAQAGVPVSGATVQAKQGSSVVASVTSDSDGYYRFENLASGSYTVLPSETGYSFSPTSLSVSFVPSSGNDFTAFGPTAPPSISSLIATPSVVPGPAATTILTAVATGSGTLAYSWDATVSAGPVGFSANDSTSASSTTVSFQLPGSYTFRVRVVDASGLPSTRTVNVTVSAGPGSIVVAPYEVQTAGGQTVSFRADAWDQLGNRISVSPLWSVNGGGTIDATGLFTATTMGGPFNVSAISGALSATGQVWVTSSGVAAAPTITVQPVGATVDVGSNATFTVVASGTGPLTYQWFFNTNVIAGANASSYTRTSVQMTDAGSYSVQVTNVVGQVMSSNAPLTVVQPPVITNQPVGLTLPLGSNAGFSVIAGGTGPLSFQWLFNGVNISGATSSSYTRTNVQHLDSGNYSVRISNVGGTIISSNAPLSVPVASLNALLTSSTNPALPALPVLFTLTLSAVSPAVGSPTGSVQFRIDGTNSGAPTPLAAGVAVYSTAAIPHGSHSISAAYAGDSNFWGSTNSLAPNQVINTPPVAGADSLQRVGTNGTKVPISSLLTNDTDPDGDLISFVSVNATSANGGTVLSNSGWIFYTPPAGSTNADSFTYNISDGFASVAGTVNVSVLADNGPSPNLTINVLSNGVYAIRGDGIPGRTYRIQWSSNPGPVWQDLGSSMADTNGIFGLTDSAGSTQRYYRSIYP